MFPFALTEKLTRNVGLSVGFYAAALARVFGRLRAPPVRIPPEKVTRQSERTKTVCTTGDFR